MTDVNKGREALEPLKLLEEKNKRLLDEWLDFPAHIHHSAFRMTDPPVERIKSRDSFLEMTKSLGIPGDRIVVAEKFAYGMGTATNGDRLILIWDAHTEYYSIQSWHIPEDKMLPIEHGPIIFPQYALPNEALGTCFNAIDIVVSPEQDLSPDLIKSSMPGHHLYGGRVFGEDISVVTSFTPDTEARERYFIYTASKEVLLRHLARVVGGIVTIETYYRLLMLPFPEFSQAVDQIHKLERGLLNRSLEITEELWTSDAKAVQTWLAHLTHDFMEASRFSEEMRFRLSASVPYSEILHATLHAQQEAPLPPFLPLYDYVHGSVSGVRDGYQQLLKRIDAFVADFQNIISVIRTRVNLMMQEQSLILEDQNLRLLANVDKTTKSQAILQHTVESLSVIVIAYYLSGLASYVFKALEKAGWLESATTASGLFVPISIVISLILTLVGGKLISKTMNAKQH